MSTPSVNRRQFLLLSVAAGAAVPLLAACGGSSTSASGSTAAATITTAASSATTAPSQSATAPASAATGAKATIRLMKFAGVGWGQDDVFTQKFMKAHPSVKVTVEPTLYNAMFQKNLTEAAAGTLADCFAGHNKWMPELYAKNICHNLDALVARNSTSMDFADFFSSVIADAKGMGANGKLFVLPTIVHPGGNAIVMFNVDLMNAAGVKLPADNNWTINDFTNIIAKAANKAKGIFGTQVIYSSPLYADQVTRTWGDSATDYSSWLLSKDGKAQQLGMPKVKTSFEWYRQLITEGLVPTSADAPPNTPGGDFFTAGRCVTQANIVGQYIADLSTINNKFKVESFLWPLGPKGFRGSCLSYNTYAMSAKTKYPDQSFELMTELSSSACGLYASVQRHSEPYARKSVWASPDLWKVNPITKAAGEWLSSGVQPFPQPYNLRFTQWLDAWSQDTGNYLNGKADWAQMYAATQQACQNILDQPRP